MGSKGTHCQQSLGLKLNLPACLVYRHAQACCAVTPHFSSILMSSQRIAVIILCASMGSLPLKFSECL